MPADPAVLHSITKLREYHALGFQVPDTKYGAMGEEAARLGLNIDYMRACRRFAQMYTAEQLDALCDACESGGYAIGWARMMLLLTVPRAAERQSLLRRAIQNNWSKSDLQAEIRRRHGVRAKPGAGRPTKLGADHSSEGAYQRALELCQRFDGLMRAMRDEDGTGNNLLDQVPRPTKTRLERAEAAMADLRRVLKPRAAGKRAARS